MYRKLTILFIILMLIIANVVTAEELSLKGSNIPSLKRDFQTDPDKFTFAIIGDKTGGGQENWPIFDKAMEEINLLNPDFAITIGDHIQGYTTDFKELKKMWDEYYSHLSVLKVPVLLVPGNHDISNTDMYIYWKGRNGKTYYSFDYKKCHFLVINTEEDKSPEGAEISVKSALDFIINDIRANKDAKHIFVFMHKPIWVSNKNLWEPIESELKGTNYSVFAGHDHHLIYESRNDHDYIVLSATGAGLDNYPEVPQLGIFHHFTLVSVSGKDANVAVIQPGNIFPANISTREYLQRVYASLAQIKPELTSPSKDGETHGKLIITQTNKIDKPVKTKFNMIDSKGWKVNPQEVILEVSPGETKQLVIEVTCNADALSNPLKYVVERYYDGKLMDKQEGKINLTDSTTSGK